MLDRMRGQALVEFALSVTVFMLLVLGTFDLARAFVAYTVVSNAAREASRYGAGHVADPSWWTGAQQAGMNLAIGLDPAALTLNVVSTPQQIDGLPYIRVSGTYLFHSITPFVAALLGDPITIQVDTSALAG